MSDFERKKKEESPVLAICYDFDKTLSPNDMQAQGYIQSVGYDVEGFWKTTNDMAHANDMDANLAYIFSKAPAFATLVPSIISLRPEEMI